MTTTLDEFILQWVGTNLTYIRRHKLTYICKQFFIFEGQNYPDDPMHVIKKLSWILFHLVVRENRNEFFVPAKSLCLGLVFFEKPEPDDL